MESRAVGQDLVIILAWVGAIWFLVWLIRHGKRWTAASLHRLRERDRMTDRARLMGWVVGCGTLAIAAHFIGLHWLEDTAGGIGILFVVAGVVAEIDDRIKAVEERVKKLEEAEPHEHG